MNESFGMQHDVRYLLAGGLAMNLRGVPRMTMDIDLVFALEQALRRLIENIPLSAVEARCRSTGDEFGPGAVT